MQYYGLATLLALLAVLILLVVVSRGWRLGWLWPWIKGNLLLAALGLSVALGLAAWDMHQFKSLQSGSNIATLEFREITPQDFEVVLTTTETRRLRLNGDLWEMDAQILRWRGFGHAIGLQDGFRLYRLSGRYLALEQQRGEVGSQSGSLHGTPRWRDTWHWLDRSGSRAVVEADAFTIRFMPMADGALFNIEIGSTGLTPVPVNQQAKDALTRFE